MYDDLWGFYLISVTLTAIVLGFSYLTLNALKRIAVALLSPNPIRYVGLWRNPHAKQPDAAPRSAATERQAPD